MERQGIRQRDTVMPYQNLDKQLGEGLVWGPTHRCPMHI